MDAKRLILPIFMAFGLAGAAFGVLQANTASAEVPYSQVSPYLRAAIKADVEAKGHQYGGDCRFDAMYLAHGQWCSMVQSVSANGVVVTYGPYATDDITTVTFVNEGHYGFKNPATGIGSPELVPALSAQPGAKPNSWVIEGINFTANEDIALFDGSGCGGEQRCPGDHRLGTVKVGADQYFKTTVQFDSDAKPLPGQTQRLIQVTGGAFIQMAFAHDGAAPSPTPIDDNPTTPAPADPGTPADPTPEKPTVDGDDSDSEKFLWAALAGLGIVVVGAVGIVTVTGRR